MAGNSDNKKPLSGKDLTAYERWELPVIDEEGNEFPAESLRVKPLTAADLEKIHDEAFAAGREAGEAEGKAAGHRAGLAKGTEEGKKQGYDTGFAAGRKEAYAAAEGEIKETQTRLAELMQALLDPIRKSEDKVEEALLNLTLAISRAVICRELNTDSSHIATIVKEALALLPEVATQVRLFIHPKDEVAVREVVANADLAARIIATPDIHPGGCKVETSSSLIDFTVEKRFQKTVQQILESVGQKSTVDEAPDLTDAMEDMTNFHRELLDVPPAKKAVEQSPENLAVDEPEVAEVSSAIDEPAAVEEKNNVVEETNVVEEPVPVVAPSDVKGSLAVEDSSDVKDSLAVEDSSDVEDLVAKTIPEQPNESAPQAQPKPVVAPPKESVSEMKVAAEAPPAKPENSVPEKEPDTQETLPKEGDVPLQNKPEEAAAEISATSSEDALQKKEALVVEAIATERQAPKEVAPSTSKEEVESKMTEATDAVDVADVEITSVTPEVDEEAALLAIDQLGEDEAEETVDKEEIDKKEIDKKEAPTVENIKPELEDKDD